MQRVAWADERLDDLSRRMDKGFEQVDCEFRDLRAEMNQGFSELRLLIWRLNGGIFVAVVVAVLLRGF